MIPRIVSVLAFTAVVAAGQGSRIPLSEPLLAKIPEMQRVIRAGLATKKPYTDRWRKGAKLFHGSFDFHSAVHAHWTLLSMARLTGDEKLRDEVLATLSPKAMAAERALLFDEKHLRKRFPYAHVWLVVLLREMEQHPYPDRPALRSFRGAIEERLVEWLETSPFPENQKTRGRDGKAETVRFCGHYLSWVFVWFGMSLEKPVDEKLEARLAAVTRDKLRPHLAELGAYEQKSAWDFLCLPGLGAAADRLLDGDDVKPYDPGELPPLPKEVTMRDTHRLGYELTRLWPLAMDVRRGDAAAKKVLERRLTEWFARKDLWDGDFAVISHWIPQFIWFNYWLAAGR